MKINFMPIKHIIAGFYFGYATMIWAYVLQLYIYYTNPYGYNANSYVNANGNLHVSPINIRVSYSVITPF
jgi:cell division septal protein FtsQ